MKEWCISRPDVVEQLCTTWTHSHPCILYYFLCSIRNQNVNPLILEIRFSSLYFDSTGNAVSPEEVSIQVLGPLVGNDDIPIGGL